MYGCGNCLHADGIFSDNRYTEKECKECSEDECNTPHDHWNMTYVPPPTNPTEPPEVFVPFKERAHFPQLEALAEPFIWVAPLVLLIVVFVIVVYTVVRANMENWKYWCIRYWG
jgi:hypothetical protein